jgi:hypothetical protein
MAKALQTFTHGKAPQLVAVDWDISHYPFFMMGGGTGVIRCNFPGGYWEIHSTEFPDFFDQDVFLASLKLYQDMELRGKVNEVTLYTHVDERTGDIIDRKTKTAKISRYKIVKEAGLTLNNAGYARVDRAFRRLALLTGFRVDKNHPEKSRMMRFLTYNDKTKKDSILCFDADFIDACVSSRLLVRYKEIRKQPTQVGKALLMYIEGNEKYFYRGILEAKIFEFFGIKKPLFPKDGGKRELRHYHTELKDYREITKEKRREMKPVLDKLVENGLIIDYRVSKRFGVAVYEIGKNRSVKEKNMQRTNKLYQTNRTKLNAKLEQKAQDDWDALFEDDIDDYPIEISG